MKSSQQWWIPQPIVKVHNSRNWKHNTFFTVPRLSIHCHLYYPFCSWRIWFFLRGMRWDLLHLQNQTKLSVNTKMDLCQYSPSFMMGLLIFKRPDKDAKKLSCSWKACQAKEDWIFQITATLLLCIEVFKLHISVFNWGGLSMSQSQNKWNCLVQSNSSTHKTDPTLRNVG